MNSKQSMIKSHLELWLLITEYYSKTFSDEVLQMYATQTDGSGISAEALNRAFNVWCVNPERCERFPMPGNLIALHRGTGSSRSAADQIANDALKAMERYSVAYGYSNPNGKTYVNFYEFVNGEFGVNVTNLIARFGGARNLAREISGSQSLSTVRAQLRDLAQSLIEAPHASQQISPTIALQGSQSGKTTLIGTQKIKLTSLVTKTVKNTSL